MECEKYAQNCQLALRGRTAVAGCVRVCVCARVVGVAHLTVANSPNSQLRSLWSSGRKSRVPGVGGGVHEMLEMCKE